MIEQAEERASDTFSGYGGVAQSDPALKPNWIVNASILLSQRWLLARVAGIALLANLAIACIIPKQFQSTARIMPPEASGSGTALLAALAGKAVGGDAFGGLAASLLSRHDTGSLFIDLMRSDTITGHLIDRFQLQSVYHKRYRVDTAKVLVRRSNIEEDKKSGIITITVKDESPRRARDLAQAYLDELNLMVNRTNTSSAHRERMFIENRLSVVKDKLDRAQEALSNFASTNMTVDLSAQTRATVDAAAKLQGELIVTEGELSSLQQIYGDGNVRVRAAQARAENLKKELAKLGGTSASLPKDADGSNSQNETTDSLAYPALRQLPRLAVPYENLYREVRIQQTIYELLTQQFEVAQIQEAKDIPVLSVIDAPGIAEKKSFPPRALLTLALTLIELLAVAAFILLRHHWRAIDLNDPRRQFARETLDALQQAVRGLTTFGRRRA